ncbi:hypothetical protein [Methylobacterium sp. D54C]
MRKANPAQAAPEAVDLRQRAATSRDAAGRFIGRTPRAEPKSAAELNVTAHGFTAGELVNEVLALWVAWAAHGDGEGTAEQIAAYETMEARRYALLDVIDALPATPETIPVKALALAWWHYVDEWHRNRKRADYDSPARLAIDIHLSVLARSDPAWRPPPVPTPTRAGILAQVDLASASLVELRTVRQAMWTLSDVAYGLASQECCRADRSGPLDSSHNPAGRLLHWLADELTTVEDRAGAEMLRRQPTDFWSRRMRLADVAERVIMNGDDAETAALIQDLTAFAAEQTGH